MKIEVLSKRIYYLKCSWCGGEDFSRRDEERVTCLSCGRSTDWYEAYKKGQKEE